MRIGWGLPTIGVMGTRDNIMTIAREAERLGYDSLWSAERLLYPINPKQNAPAWPITYKQSLGTLDVLMFVAALTEKIRLGTSTLNIAFYHPARLAKAITTLDVLSNGRAVICAGLGWSEDEYDASGVPFSQRSGRLTEVLEALNVLWGENPVEFHGRYYDVPATLFNPKPVQKPRPPILLAGTTPAAFARAARLTDGFNPLVGPNAADAENLMAMLRQVWYEAGREPAAPEIIVRVNHGRITDQPLDDDRMFLVGSLDQVYEDVAKLAAWGATEVFFSVRAGNENPDEDIRFNLEQMTKLRAVI